MALRESNLLLPQAIAACHARVRLARRQLRAEKVEQSSAWSVRHRGHGGDALHDRDRLRAGEIRRRVRGWRREEFFGNRNPNFRPEGSEPESPPTSSPFALGMARAEETASNVSGYTSE